MAIPDFQTVMLPLLQFASDQQEKSLRDAVTAISDKFNLLEEERAQRIPSGGQTTIMNRVGWAATYLRKAELLELTRRGYFKITQLGLDILKQSPTRIDLNFLSRYEGVKQFRARSSRPPRLCRCAAILLKSELTARDRPALPQAANTWLCRHVSNAAAESSKVSPRATTFADVARKVFRANCASLDR